MASTRSPRCPGERPLFSARDAGVDVKLPFAMTGPKALSDQFFGSSLAVVASGH